VGAEYFDHLGKPSNPDQGGEALEDQGGNALFIVLNDLDDHGRPNSADKFHGFWDSKAVSAAFRLINADIKKDNPGHSPQVKVVERVKRLAKLEPNDWKLPANVDVHQWAEKWADEILPVAREAHERLKFVGVHPSEHNPREVEGFVAPKENLIPAYPEWSGGVIYKQLHKAGWRLAALLEEIL
jgi:hypothetical protein